MKHKLLSLRDLHFLLFDVLRTEELFCRPHFNSHSRSTAEAILQLAEDIASKEFAPHNRKADLNEPRIADNRVEIIPEVGAALGHFRESGFFGMTASIENGGMQLPLSIANAAVAFFQAANPGTAGYAFLTIAAANMLSRFGSEAHHARYLRAMIEGRFYGTMCLSEPHAGSSLADLVTKAVPDGDSTFRVFGRKMWTSGGDHELSENIVHMVLARMPDAPSGTRGLSLFLTPKYIVTDNGQYERNDVTLSGLNHKMGYRGTANAALTFGDGAFLPHGRPGAVAYLVGEPNKGLDIMFHMMNEARIGVGLNAASLGYTGYLHALAYSRERAQGRLPGNSDPATPQVAIINHPDVRRMLLAQKAYAEGALMLCLLCSRLYDDSISLPSLEDQEEARGVLELLTPVAKSWPAQYCLEANSLAIQVHGGYGYTRDFPVEQMYRDNRLNAIHEGTNGIQALDLVTRKLKRNNARVLASLTTRIAATCLAARSADDELSSYAVALETLFGKIDAVTGTAPEPETIANATLVLEVFGHACIAWLWLWQALAARQSNHVLAQEKLQACRYFFRWELPQTRWRIDLLLSREKLLLEDFPPHS